MSNFNSDPRSETIMRLVRIARGLEAGGIYNAAKLFWALAFSHEIQASSRAGLPRTPAELEAEIEIVIHELEAEGTDAALVKALRSGQQGARQNTTILWKDTPAVQVCRLCGEIMLGDAPGSCPTCQAEELTFKEFVPIYFLEPLSPMQALQALSSTPSEVAEMIVGLTEEQLAQPPAQGEWAIRDTIAHLVVAQGLLAGRIDIILSQDNPDLASMAAWTVESPEGLTTAELLEHYTAVRRGIVERLSGITFQDWWRPALHEEFGVVSLLMQATYFARHERSHFPQIRAVRRLVGI